MATIPRENALRKSKSLATVRNRSHCYYLLKGTNCNGLQNHYLSRHTCLSLGFACNLDGRRASHFQAWDRTCNAKARPCTQMAAALLTIWHRPGCPRSRSAPQSPLGARAWTPRGPCRDTCPQEIHAPRRHHIATAIRVQGFSLRCLWVASVAARWASPSTSHTAAQPRCKAGPCARGNCEAQP